jgi:hypothetical protein
VSSIFSTHLRKSVNSGNPLEKSFNPLMNSAEPGNAYLLISHRLSKNVNQEIGVPGEIHALP